MHLIECIVGKIYVSFLGRTHSFFIFYGMNRNNIKNTLGLCFDKASFLGLLFRSIWTKDWIKGEQLRGPYEGNCSTPKADIIHCLCHPSHWAWEQTMILLRDWNLLWRKNIFLQRSLCFIILFKYSHLLEVFLKLSGTQGLKYFPISPSFERPWSFPCFVDVT